MLADGVAPAVVGETCIHHGAMEGDEGVFLQVVAGGGFAEGGDEAGGTLLIGSLAFDRVGRFGLT